ncbi:MAG: glycine betaine/proline transport system substrate-binding protein [Phenylobacterium sp.]|jgi:glycine betaine/proline transport system substrate-binding protein
MIRCSILFLLFFNLVGSVCHANHEKGQTAVILPLNEWTSQRVLTKMLGNLIEQMKIPVHYQELHSKDQWGALRIGVVHLQIEVWGDSTRQIFQSMVNNNHIIDMGLHTATIREEWWYPEYVEKLCPGLPDWQALNRCASLFAHQNPAITLSNGTKTKLKGVYYNGPWEYNDAGLIRALKLDFTIERVANSDILWQKLKQASRILKPIVLINWTPNWVDARMKGKFVEFPAYSPECESNPEWGINPSLIMDCGNPKGFWLKKAAWPGLQKRWPCVYQLLKAVTLDNAMISEAAALVVNDGYSEEQAGAIWLQKYQRAARQWMQSACQPQQ